MSDPGTRTWQFYLDDMIGFAEKVLAYTQSFDQAGFVASQLYYDATLRNLELIGEAATHIPDSVRGEFAYPLAVDHCHAQSAYPWLPGHR